MDRLGGGQPSPVHRTWDRTPRCRQCAIGHDGFPEGVTARPADDRCDAQGVAGPAAGGRAKAEACRETVTVLASSLCCVAGVMSRPWSIEELYERVMASAD